MTTKDFQVQDFDRVQVENGFQVTISQGESFMVTVTTHENIVPYVRVEKNGSTLRLYVDPRPFTGVSVNHLEATVTMPALEEINGSGGSRLIVAGFQRQPSLAVRLSGGSQLNSDMSATDIRMQSSGGSGGQLAGKASTLNFTSNGGDHFDLSKLDVGSANVKLSGGSSLIVNAERLSYELSGGSQLHYIGNPQIGAHQSSGGSSATSINS